MGKLRRNWKRELVLSWIVNWLKAENSEGNKLNKNFKSERSGILQGLVLGLGLLNHKLVILSYG